MNAIFCCADKEIALSGLKCMKDKGILNGEKEWRNEKTRHIFDI